MAQCQPSLLLQAVLPGQAPRESCSLSAPGTQGLRPRESPNCSGSETSPSAWGGSPQAPWARWWGPEEQPSPAPRYIENPLLLDGKKFDVRSYLLIACAMPYMVFFGHGYARLTLSLYDPDSQDLSGHLTNQVRVLPQPREEITAQEPRGEASADLAQAWRGSSP